MLDQILAYFPAYTHPLTLVHDPDDLLADDDVLAALAERGFTLLNESDPVVLRQRVQQLQPLRLERPVVIVTAGPLNELPYDLWQMGHAVQLALYTFFPNLSYPVVQRLSSHQRWLLGQAPPPARALGRQATLDFVLSHVFGLEYARLHQPAWLITWLSNYHLTLAPMPLVLHQHLLARLQSIAGYKEWPLAEMLAEQEAFQRFVNTQWRGYLQQQTGQRLAEPGQNYLLPFASDAGLQDTVSRLVREGALTPVRITQPEGLPPWMRVGVLAPDEDDRARRMAELLELLKEQAEPREGLAEARWEPWQAVARTWAELTTLYYDPAGATDQAGSSSQMPYTYAWWQVQLDRAFLAWLQRYYAPLAGRKLPVPHHLYHVGAYMAFRRTGRERLALLVMDGMSLADWYRVSQVWQSRHPAWQFQQQLVLAQIPSITAVSRQALLAGLRPVDFSDTLTHNRQEGQRWAAFWEQAGLSGSGCRYVHLDADPAGALAEVSSTRWVTLCLVNRAIDELAHSTTQGTVGLHAALSLWLKNNSPALESLIETLLAGKVTVYVTSDHGHTEARGLGQPSEGLALETRSKRARLYQDHRTAAAIHQGFPEAVIWGQDNLLPPNTWALIPTGRQAFAPLNEIVVTHGGLTLDEMVVPLVRIASQD